MQQLELKCFGTADGTPCPDRNYSAFLYRLDHTSILLDCGEPLCRSFTEAGLSFSALDHIVLSHLHFDHIGGFFMFVQGLWLEKRRRALTVRLPADGIEPIQQLLKASCLCPEILPFRLGFEALQDRQTFSVKEVRVTPFLNTHLDGFKRRLLPKYPLRLESFSFLLESDSFRVAHSADIGAVKDLEPLLEQPLDLLVCEVAHIHPEALAQFVRGRSVRCVAFIHFGRPQWARFAEVRKLFGRLLPDVTLLYPRDGQVLTVKATASESK